MNSGSVLVFFTDTFPCGKGETFIENEFPFLARAFSRIYIVTNNLKDPVTRQVSEHTRVVRYPYQPGNAAKFTALLQWFHHPLKQERVFLKNNLQLSLTKQRSTIMLGAFAKMLETESFLNNLIAQENINKANLFLYAYWFNNMAASIAWFKHKSPEVKAFCRAHRWDIYAEQQPGAYLPFRQFTIANLSGCYPISQHGLEYISQQTNHIADNKIHLARLGTSSPTTIPPSGNTDKICLVSCSLVIPRKRLDLIIEALAKVNDIPVEWTHYGDGPLLQEVKALADERLSSLSNIRYRFAGHLSNSDLLQKYQTDKYDLFINVSSSEGVPVSIMEAISFGIPAIATDTGGSSEVVVKDQSGYLLPVNLSAQQLADTIRLFWALPAPAKELLRKNAHRFWAANFNASNNYSAFLKSLENDL